MLHVYQVYLPEDFTGIPRVIWEMCEGMAKYGVESEVLCLAKNSPPMRLKIDGHIVHQVRTDFRVASTSFSFSIFKMFRELISRFDVVHYHFPWPPGDLLFLLAGRAKPSIVSYHSDIVKQRLLKKLYSPIQKLFLGNVDAIVAASPNYLASSPVLAKYRNKVSVIPYGLAERILPSEDLMSYWKEKVGEGFFLFVGSQRYYKGLQFLLQAARINGLPVVLAGARLSENLDLPENVINLGQVSDADREALLELCLAFVFPSHLRSEAFGVALLEAARAGRPMISCEIGTGTTFVNQANETGIVVPPRDPLAVAEAMLKITLDTKLSRRLGKAARHRYETLFRSEIMSESYIGLYSETM